MNVTLPPEFERVARAQVKAGLVASEEEAVVNVLRDYVADFCELTILVDEGFASLELGEGVDGEAFMQELLAETKALAQAG